jgi:hypothetical protein
MKNRFRVGIYFLSHNIKYIYLFILLFLVYVVLLPQIGQDDIKIFANWAIFICKNGLHNAYKTPTNYVPLYYYMLFPFEKIQGSADAIKNNMYYLKIIPLVFDFIAGYYLFRYLHTVYKNIHQSAILSLFFFLNIAYLFNTLVFGQIDSINACFIFLSIFFAMQQKVLAAFIFILLGINLKLLSGIFLPLIGLMLLPAIIRQFSLKKLAVWISIPILLQFLIVLPFLLAGDLDKILHIVNNTVGKYPVISWGAFNLWYLVMEKGDLRCVPDYICLWGIQGLTYKHIGLSLFFATGFMALFPLLKRAWSHMFYKQNVYFEPEKLFIIAALIPLLFFFCNTEMMSRYSHTAFLFLAAYSLSTGKYLPYISGSIGYFLNLKVEWSLGPLNHHWFFFEPRFIAFLYFITILYLFLQLYDINLSPKRR